MSSKHRSKRDAKRRRQRMAAKRNRYSRQWWLELEAREGAGIARLVWLMRGMPPEYEREI